MKNILFPLLHRVASGVMEEGILRYTLHFAHHPGDAQRPPEAVLQLGWEKMP